MTTIDLQLDTIRRARANLDPARVFGTIFLAFFWVPGWLARMFVRAIWWVLSYAVMAVVTGWKAGAPVRERGGG